jgi:hypothetical protein
LASAVTAVPSAVDQAASTEGAAVDANAAVAPNGAKLHTEDSDSGGSYRGSSSDDDDDDSSDESEEGESGSSSGDEEDDAHEQQQLETGNGKKRVIGDVLNDSNVDVEVSSKKRSR